ncbi:Ubiquitin family [Popillia japonica]|uniref:Ubiquitin family n=1 Tax=Popillia japonica TaxID=7064 RepID=A0AAW1MGC1_POPJA
MRQYIPEIGVSTAVTPDNHILNPEEDDLDVVDTEMDNRGPPQQEPQNDDDEHEVNFTFVTEDTAFVTKNYLGIDPATGLIEIFVHLNKKENFILQRTATIATLKQMILDRKGIPTNIQRLVFAGKVLQNNTTLQENGIICGSSIHLFIRLRGGYPNTCNLEVADTDSTKVEVENYM